MRNKLVILAIFLVPLIMFGVLQYTSKESAANATVQTTNFGKGKLLKFHSPMCSECKTVGAHVKNAMQGYEGAILYEEIDVTNKDPKTQGMIETYKVTVVPTVVFINKNGEISFKKEGLIEESEIKTNLDGIK